MKTQPLLSVIVPCYNVEKYIDKCISSIVGQTYSNLEILLIDDGSPDNSGAICDAWQLRDKRIRVIHKQNEGSSYARKTGIENATAEYVTFVDSDDWVDKDMYQNMMNALLFTHSDIVQCGVCDTDVDGIIYHRSSEYKDGSFEIVDRVQSVLLIIEGKKWQSYMVNKIFKKHLFNNVTFPRRGLHEDLSIVYLLFHHADQTVYLRDEYYYYLRRSGSISTAENVALKMKNRYDTSNAYYERYLFVKQHPEYHSLLQPICKSAMQTAVLSLQGMIDAPQFFPKHAYEIQAERLKSFSLSLRYGKHFIYNIDLLVLKLFHSCYKSYYKMTYRNLKRLYSFFKNMF